MVEENGQHEALLIDQGSVIGQGLLHGVETLV